MLVVVWRLLRCLLCVACSLLSVCCLRVGDRCACLLFVEWLCGCCSLLTVCCMLLCCLVCLVWCVCCVASVVRRCRLSLSLVVSGCSLIVDCWLLFVVWYAKAVVCRLLDARCVLFLGGCSLCIVV